ncbi:protein-L-isoaspartate(D-aspartate) O-methyltransferase [Halanaerobacter jeridensis]|uniref:Protein-L-isoaspartate O-methyltransferase n=1 Tax=Halanaerobacter jeridensis TaxID=706427 RepID=A0A938XXC8_9FIRM|nr:protein-L-isoaspartate(D-aspartate) O-methyltransferase [Halanaerobacter jeridensis]MBM7557387.1 protein-L-isoaspartate(D-aspartate) O-methyltransferase [Halanaerobacter jeridensis]
MGDDSLNDAKEKMIKQHLIPRGIKNERVLAAFKKVPREEFVPPEIEAEAYQDRPLPIGEGQTISQPYIVAEMIQALEPTPGDKILEIGTGSGYAAAVLAEIVETVYGVERHQSLVDEAQTRLTRLNYDNVKLEVGDGTIGWAENAPYDGILVSAAAPEIPNSLVEQLVKGGYLVIPIGTKNIQQLYQIKKIEDDKITKKELGRVRFVPLLGEKGW